MAEKNLIKIYVNATSAKRVDIIIRHYTDYLLNDRKTCVLYCERKEVCRWML